MLVLHEKSCSTATHTISGGADVVKPITSHDIQYEGTGNILLAKGVGIQLNDTVERQTIAKQNNHDK